MATRTLFSFNNKKPRKKATKSKTKTKTVKRLKQSGTQSKKGMKHDKSRKKAALPPGRRVMANGKKYTETRKNRSDVNSKRRI